MISDECSGLFQNVTVNYNHVSVVENDVTNVTVYPNPARDFVKLSAIRYQLSVVRIYNYLGILIEEIDVDSNEVEINTSGYNSGVYFINIETNKGKVVCKVVKL